MNSDPNPLNRPQEIEPAAGSARAPVWLFVLVAVLAFWGMGFLDNHGGGFDPLVYKPYKSLAELKADQPRTGNDVFRKGQKVFETYCILCHQATGKGLPNQFPPLAGSEWVQAKDPGRLIRLVLDGIQGTITVNGQQLTGAMPPWKENLTDEDIASVLTYIRGNQEWGNSASEVTPDQVKAIRAKMAGRSTAWSPDELLKVNENE
jgi:mono/diheme cytochrome c family protein